MTGSFSPSPVAVNGYLTYTYTITNPGPDDATATFTTTLPSTLSFVQVVSTSGVVSRNNSTITVTFSPLAANAQATITILTVPTSAGTITTSATVTAPEDPNSGNNTVNLSATAQQGIDLTVTGQGIPDPSHVGEELAYRFVITNAGQVTATGTKAFETLPSNLELVSVTTSQGVVTSDATTGQINVALGDLAVNASAVVTVVVKPKAEGAAWNALAASANEPEINTANNAAFVGVNVLPAVPPTPPDTLAPTVTRLTRFGVGRQPTSILVGFSEQMDPTSAQNLANYTLVTAGRDHRFGTADDVRVPLRAAAYDSTNQWAVVTTFHPVALAMPVQITVNGSTPTGVRGLDGLLLDGANTGQAGSNFVRAFRGFGPGTLTAATASTTARAARFGCRRFG